MIIDEATWRWIRDGGLDGDWICEVVKGARARGLGDERMTELLGGAVMRAHGFGQSWTEDDEWELAEVLHAPILGIEC